MAAAPGQGVGEKRAEIYTYDAPWLIYAMNWSVSTPVRTRARFRHPVTRVACLSVTDLPCLARTLRQCTPRVVCDEFLTSAAQLVRRWSSNVSFSARSSRHGSTRTGDICATSTPRSRLRCSVRDCEAQHCEGESAVGDHHLTKT